MFTRQSLSHFANGTDDRRNVLSSDGYESRNRQRGDSRNIPHIKMFYRQRANLLFAV